MVQIIIKENILSFFWLFWIYSLYLIIYILFYSISFFVTFLLNLFEFEEGIIFKFLKNGILLPKLFWPTVNKNCSSDREKLLKFEAEGREFAKFLRSLEQFIQTVKGQNNFW